MTRNKDKLISFTTMNGGKVTFRDNSKGKVIGKVRELSNYFIDDVVLVEGLKHKLVSISQFCDKGNEITFNIAQCLVINQVEKQVKLAVKRIYNIYMIDLDSKITLDASCLVSLNEDTWIWHMRLAHASMDLIGKLSRKDLVVGFLKLN